MKVLREGKEVKSAKVFYNNQSGAPLYVEEDGVNYDASAYTFEGAREQVVEKGDVLSTESIVSGETAKAEDKENAPVKTSKKNK